MFKIGDFSQLAQVTVRTLRLYDEMGLLRPAQIDKFTSYRYYTLEQLPRLNRILALKDLGLSLEAIADLLNGKLKDAQLYELLAEKQAEIEREMKASQARLARVAARLKQIEQEGRPPKYEVVLKRIEPLWIASVRGLVPQVEQMREYRTAAARQLYEALEKHDVTPVESEIFLYHNTEYTDTDIDMEVGTAIEKAAAKTLKPGGGLSVRELPAAGQAASTIHEGPVWQVPQAIVALFLWIGANHFTSTDAIRELHLFWRQLEMTDEKFENVVLEMQIPVAALELVKE